MVPYKPATNGLPMNEVMVNKLTSRISKTRKRLFFRKFMIHLWVLTINFMN